MTTDDFDFYCLHCQAWRYATHDSTQGVQVCGTCWTIVPAGVKTERTTQLDVLTDLHWRGRWWTKGEVIACGISEAKALELDGKVRRIGGK